MPSYSELAEIFNFKSKCGAQNLAKKWLNQGILKKDDKGRLIPGKMLNPLKVLGSVKAGWPSPAEEENADTISLDDWLIEDKEASFMLKVNGDSMVDAGIMPGDLVILERGRLPKNGDIVVAEVDREWTIKYLERKTDSENRDRVRLIAANKNYPPILPREEMRIAGVVTAVIRKYSGSAPKK
jgi:repressor LexA